MASKRVRLKVVFSDGRPVSGAAVRAYNSTAWISSIKNWDNTTDLDGISLFENLDTGYGDKYDFSVKYIDRDGVLYLGDLSDKIMNDMDRQITLRVAYPDEIESVSIPIDSLNVLLLEVDGPLVAEGLRELGAALRFHMIHASLALSTYVMEGMIRIKAKQANAWHDEFEELTYGQLIERTEIKSLFSDSEFEGARLLNKHRLFGAHFRGANSILAQAQICFKIVSDTLSKWFVPIRTDTTVDLDHSESVDADSAP